MYVVFIFMILYCFFLSVEWFWFYCSIAGCWKSKAAFWGVSVRNQKQILSFHFPERWEKR